MGLESFRVSFASECHMLTGKYQDIGNKCEGVSEEVVSIRQRKAWNYEGTVW